jgi:hypothetical protein
LRNSKRSQYGWTTLEMMYLARFYDVDGVRSMAKALDRTVPMTFEMYKRMQRDGSLRFWKEK